MDCKIVVFFFVFFAMLSCKPESKTSDTDSNTSIYTKEELLKDRENSKNYALCICLSLKGYSHVNELKKDNSAYSYISKGLKHPQFYSALSVFTKSEIKKYNYKSFEGEQTASKMTECIDFYNSQALENYIISIEKKDFNE